jgi:hypothetical protein
MTVTLSSAPIRRNAFGAKRGLGCRLRGQAARRRAARRAPPLEADGEDGKDR